MKRFWFLLVILFAFTAFPQNVIKEKYSGTGLNAKVEVLVEHNGQFYLGTGLGSYQFAQSQAIMNAEWKIKNTPNDTLNKNQRVHLFNYNK